MKKAIILLLAFIPFTGRSQSTALARTNEKFSVGFKPAWLLNFDDAEEKVIRKEWISFLKDRDAKVKSTGDFINGLNAEYRQISPDTINIFSSIKSYDKQVQISVTFAEKYITFYPEMNDMSKNAMIEEILYAFAVKTKKLIVANEIAIADKALQKLKDNFESLDKRNNKLAGNNEDMKNQISKNEKEIEENKEKMADFKKQIGGQESTVKMLNEKQNSIR